MRFLVVLLVIAAVSFAAGTLRGGPGGVANYTLPETDDVLDTYAYVAAEQMSNIGASFDDYATIDDYNGVAANINTYTMWGVTTASAPTTLDLMVFADDAGVPTSAGATSMETYPTTSSDTGMTYGSYAIWIAVIDCSAAPVAVMTTDWVGSHRSDGSNWYPIGGTVVTDSEAYRTLAAGWAWEPFSTSLVAGDLFKVIDGTPVSSLERNTWAGIKNMF